MTAEEGKSQKRRWHQKRHGPLPNYFLYGNNLLDTVKDVNICIKKNISWCFIIIVFLTVYIMRIFKKKIKYQTFKTLVLRPQSLNIKILFNFKLNWSLSQLPPCFLPLIFKVDYVTVMSGKLLGQFLKQYCKFCSFLTEILPIFLLLKKKPL